MLLPIHIAAGAVAILLGAIPLLVKKGGITHRRAGQMFVAVMVIMAASGAVLAALKGERGNMMMGILTIYLVATAALTVRPHPRWMDGAVMLAAFGIGVYAISLGLEIRSSPGGTMDGLPPGPAFLFGTLALFMAFGDSRVLIRGVHGARRLRRHLWRMCFALFIAAGSFFSIEERVAKVLPEPFTTAPMRTLPIVLVFAAMFYWLWKVRGGRPVPPRIQTRSTGDRAPAFPGVNAIPAGALDRKVVGLSGSSRG